jgi:hypothetical protein
VTVRIRADRRRGPAVLGASLLALSVIGAACNSAGSSAPPKRTTTSSTPASISSTPTSSTKPEAASAVSTSPSSTLGSSSALVTSSTAPAGPGLVTGRVTAIGDSVMVDYEAALQHDLPGAQVEAAVSRQWSAGIAEARSLRQSGALGATVVIGLGTNGPISQADFEAMMGALAGASRVVFVTVFVDQPWQNEVNTTLRAGLPRHKNAVLADWAGLAARHRDWLYSDGTHLPIGGAGALALAALVTHAVNQG